MNWTRFKCIFVHIPKTGGTSVEVYFKDYLKEQFVKEEKHLTAQEAKELYPEWDDSFTFSFVRNPWERVFSYWYNYYNLFQQTARTKKTFLDFLYKLRDDNKWQCTNNVVLACGDIINETTINQVARKHLLPQMEWLTDKNGNIIVDFIGRFDNIRADFDTIRDKLKVDKTYALGNILWLKDKPPCYAFYNDECIQIVEDIYEKDIDNFGYRYEDCLS